MITSAAPAITTNNPMCRFILWYACRWHAATPEAWVVGMLHAGGVRTDYPAKFPIGPSGFTIGFNTE